MQPFTSRVLVDNGEAGLTLATMTPNLWSAQAAADFVLTLRGTGFTTNSVTRWNGFARPTGFVSGSVLTATISAADVSAVAQVPVTVYDPTASPMETTPLMFFVVDTIFPIHLPLVLR